MLHIKDRMKASVDVAPATEYLVEDVKRTETDLCVHCEEKSCQEGRLLTDYKQSYNGQRVRLVGENWSEDMKNKVGVVVGFQDHYLRLRWLQAGKLEIEMEGRTSGEEVQVDQQFSSLRCRVPLHILLQ